MKTGRQTLKRPLTGNHFSRILTGSPLSLSNWLSLLLKYCVILREALRELQMRLGLIGVRTKEIGTRLNARLMSFSELWHF